jgi:two-component system, NtrC family, nitrogen regulation sensor histidine kinase NtrY
MKVKSYRIFIVVLTVVVILLALAAESLYFSDFEYRVRTRMFNKTLAVKEKILDDCLADIKPILALEDHHGSSSENSLFSVAEQNGVTILEYMDNKLFYWSDNEFNVPVVRDDSLFSKPFIFLQNGWFLTRTIQAGNEMVVGLLRIYTDYSFDNDIIKSGFVRDFKMPQDAEFTFNRNESEFHVFGSSGNYLFSLAFPGIKQNSCYILFPVLLWTVAFILVIILTLEFVKILTGKGKELLAAGFTLLIFSLVYFLFLITGKPEVFLKMELFSPYRFSLNGLIPSLGHLLMFSILTSIFSNRFFRDLPLLEPVRCSKLRIYFFLTLSMLAGAILLYLVHLVFNRLILTSNINFETYKVLSLDIYSFAGFTSILLLLVVPVFFLIRILRCVRDCPVRLVSMSLASSLIILAPLFWHDSADFLPLAVFYSVLTGIIWINLHRKIGYFNITVIYALIFGAYTLYIITGLSEKKSDENLKVQAVSLSTENDPEAEHRLLNIWPELVNDTTLDDMMNDDFQDVRRIEAYLQDKYFSDYWRNYEFIPVRCRSTDSLHIRPGNVIFENCFSFFNDLIRHNGHKLTGTDFYFIDNQGGRSCYIGMLFFRKSGAVTNGLFMELISDVSVYQAGYSELLLDKKYRGYTTMKDYSFAKYINGEIVLRTGDFPYDKTDDDYIAEDSDYREFNTNGYKHILYRNGNTTVLISRPEISLDDIVISFAYLFAFIFLFLNLARFIFRKYNFRGSFIFNFRQKIQLSSIGVLLFSFILIGAVVATFTIKQYQIKHNENLRQKLNSIYLELESIIAGEKQLTENWRNSAYGSLNELLIRFSNIFETDINLYDLRGFLIATSRPEIFNRELTSRRMNNAALTNLWHFTRSEYFQKEKIGTLEYISAYLPFFNNDKNVIAYLNLPYFRMQSVLAKEISNLIVAVINFSLLFILITMGFAVFISGRLTSPLMMLGEGLASVEVGRKSEHLSYSGHDEIGELVRQYNRMVDEIDESSRKLANSEREYAWREMAKQIAHEIKNPLTPMKLNIQQLYKAWNDKVPDFETKLEQFTRNQIEYIDSLSSIASAFSSFAKLPGSNPVEINLLDQVRVVLDLFRETDNVNFHVNWPRESKIMIYIDKEHLNGVFSNLIKNGIQSIPPGLSGMINVNFDIKGDKVITSVSDNGSGIPEELKKKLFTPNFTTKSSGMGLGLSIVKRYVENANGRVWFESEIDKGTVFYVELPLLYTVEKLR